MKAAAAAEPAPLEKLTLQWNEAVEIVKLLRAENRALRRDRDEWKRRAKAAEKEARRAR